MSDVLWNISLRLFGVTGNQLLENDPFRQGSLETSGKAMQ